MIRDKRCPYKFSVQELEDGYAIQIKGDKEQLKAKVEAIEAYLNFREKAKVAGFSRRPGRSRDRFNLLHKHFKMMHDKYRRPEGEKE